jgi:hypothetical protein
MKHSVIQLVYIYNLFCGAASCWCCSGFVSSKETWYGFGSDSILYTFWWKIINWYLFTAPAPSRNSLAVLAPDPLHFLYLLSIFCLEAGLWKIDWILTKPAAIFITTCFFIVIVFSWAMGCPANASDSLAQNLRISAIRRNQHQIGFLLFSKARMLW